MHEGHEREGLRRRSRGVLGENEGQSQRVATQLPADGRLRAGREVALGEEEVEDRLDGGQARRKLLPGEVIGPDRKLSKPRSSTAEALVHIGFGGEEALRDLANVETAERLEGDRQLGLDGDRVVATDEK